MHISVELYHSECVLKDKHCLDISQCVPRIEIIEDQQSCTQLSRYVSSPMACLFSETSFWLKTVVALLLSYLLFLVQVLQQR